MNRMIEFMLKYEIIPADKVKFEVKCIEKLLCTHQDTKYFRR